MFALDTLTRLNADFQARLDAQAAHASFVALEAAIRNVAHTAHTPNPACQIDPAAPITLGDFIQARTHTHGG